MDVVLGVCTPQVMQISGTAECIMDAPGKVTTASPRLLEDALKYLTTNPAPSLLQLLQKLGESSSMV